MSNIVGNSGIIKIGGTAIGSVVSFSLSLVGDQVESTVLGSEWRTMLTTLKSWSGSANLYFDNADPIQALLQINALLTFELLPEGEVTGGYMAAGSAFIATVDQSNEIEAVFNRDVTFTGTGELTISAIA